MKPFTLASHWLTRSLLLRVVSLNSFDNTTVSRGLMLDAVTVFLAYCIAYLATSMGWLCTGGSQVGYYSLENCT